MALFINIIYSSGYLANTVLRSCLIPLPASHADGKWYKQKTGVHGVQLTSYKLRLAGDS